jgi:hypothetical protein
MGPGAGVLGRRDAPWTVRARAPARREALALLEEESLARPAIAWRVWPVRSAQGAQFDLGEYSLEIPAFAGYSGGIASLAAVACSLGPGLERRAASLFRARRRLLALELDALGTERLFALADHLVARVRSDARRAGLRAGAELNPGDEGLALGAQHTVLALADAGRQGIAATAAGMLWPVKSLTFVVALGCALPEFRGDRCDRCSARDRCQSRPR